MALEILQQLSVHLRFIEDARDNGVSDVEFGDAVIVFLKQVLLRPAIPVADAERQRAAVECAPSPLIKQVGQRQQRPAQFLLVREHGLLAKFALK